MGLFPSALRGCFGGAELCLGGGRIPGCAEPPSVYVRGSYRARLTTHLSTSCTELTPLPVCCLSPEALFPGRGLQELKTWGRWGFFEEASFLSGAEEKRFKLPVIFSP